MRKMPELIMFANTDDDRLLATPLRSPKNRAKPLARKRRTKKSTNNTLSDNIPAPSHPLPIFDLPPLNPHSKFHDYRSYEAHINTNFNLGLNDISHISKVSIEKLFHCFFFLFVLSKQIIQIDN